MARIMDVTADRLRRVLGRTAHVSLRRETVHPHDRDQRDDSEGEARSHQPTACHRRRLPSRHQPTCMVSSRCPNLRISELAECPGDALGEVLQLLGALA